MTEIELRDYSPDLAAEVFRNLDTYDWLEAAAVHGARQPHQQLFGDWHAVAQHQICSVVAVTRQYGMWVPFAVAGLVNTGQFGVAGAALLASHHKKYRRALAKLITEGRPVFHDLCRTKGIVRVEARCWSGHPTAATLLKALGFQHEADMPGFGGGTDMFRQFAFIPTQPPVTHPPEIQPPERS